MNTKYISNGCQNRGNTLLCKWSVQSSCSPWHVCAQNRCLAWVSGKDHFFVLCNKVKQNIQVHGFRHFNRQSMEHPGKMRSDMDNFANIAESTEWRKQEISKLSYNSNSNWVELRLALISTMWISIMSKPIKLILYLMKIYQKLFLCHVVFVKENWIREFLVKKVLVKKIIGQKKKMLAKKSF